MKWSFIDYENIGCLSKVDLSIYEKVVIFLGAKQPKIDFGDKRYDSPIEIVVIHINAIQANNLDFHLSYYLGKYDQEASPNVSFDVISNDNGFSPLLSHIKSNGRLCKQVKTNAAPCQQNKPKVTPSKAVQPANAPNDVTKLIQSLTSKPKEKRPQKVESLKNHIASHTRSQGNEVAIQNYLNHLVNKKILTVSEKAIKYK